MSASLAHHFRELIPGIMQEWDGRVRAEVTAAAPQPEVILRNSLHLMLEVLAKVLADETDPRTAARDLAYITLHAEERARQPIYSLGEVIRECNILLEVVLESLHSEHTPSTHELTVITRYFNEMIHVSADEYVRVQKQILQEQADRLAAMHRSKDEFLAMLGHELRNPLSAISNSLVLLRDGAHRGELPEFALDIAERQMSHVKRMVDDLLDLSRITQGRVVLGVEPLDLGLAVQQSVEDVRGLIRQRQHAIIVSHPRERIHVKADPVRLGQCLSNLLTNAAKYTNPGGHIEVSLDRAGPEARIRVRDDGIGIAAHLLPDIFDLFQQAERGLDRTGEGLGIGLTVVKRLIELHGGTVEARSEGLGEGSEFMIRLPILEEVPDKPAAPVRQRATLRHRILLVEDHADAAEVMRKVLEMWGHQVTAVANGPAALEAVAQNCPDVALVDIGLPGMSGYELAGKLRAGGWCPTMKLVAMTGYAKDVASLVAAGFDMHMSKPVDLQQLEDMLSSMER